MQITNQYIDTVGGVMAVIAPSAGGVIPDEASEEYAQWLLFIQIKYEEASRRGFWRRLLKKSDLVVTEGDESVYLPIDFQRANSLYITYIGGVDLSNPDRVPDSQSIFVEVDTAPFLVDNVTTNPYFGRWRMTFSTPIKTSETAYIWYFCTPPKPTSATDIILLPGDMIAFGALAEVARTTNLSGSLDDARQEYENRLSTYLSLEMIPARDEILSFVTNPRRTDRTLKARNQWSTTQSRRISKM